MFVTLLEYFTHLISCWFGFSEIDMVKVFYSANKGMG